MANDRVIYKILLLQNGIQKDYIGWFGSATEALKTFKELIAQNQYVKVPQRCINATEIINGKRVTSIKDVKHELAIVKTKEENENAIVKLKNEYGQYVDHTTTSENWVLYEKEPYYLEETFWVYGYNPLRQRKNCDFIFKELIQDSATNKDNMINIKLYRNKLLFEKFDKLDFVTCKDKPTAIALYNALERLSNEFKVKYVLFSGDWSLSNRARLCEAQLQDLTHWKLKKIQRHSTRP